MGGRGIFETSLPDLDHDDIPHGKPFCPSCLYWLENKGFLCAECDRRFCDQSCAANLSRHACVSAIKLRSVKEQARMVKHSMAQARA